jgi:hypothetical protein
MPPRGSWRPRGEASGEHGEAALVRVPGRQHELDARDHFGDPAGDLDQAETDRFIQPVPASAGRSIVGDRGNKFETGAFRRSRQLAPVIR